MKPPRVLVASVGSTLRGDDGFGPAVMARLQPRLPREVEAGDFGTQGLALVQRLYDRYDALVLIDACRRGRAAGTLYVMAPDVPAAPTRGDLAAFDALADAHVTNPGRILMLARSLGVLPAAVWLVGCEPEKTEDHFLGLSKPVIAAINAAIDETLALVDRLMSVDGTGRTATI